MESGLEFGTAFGLLDAHAGGQYWLVQNDGKHQVDKNNISYNDCFEKK